MEEENITLMEMLELVYGKKEKDLNGLMDLVMKINQQVNIIYYLPYPKDPNKFLTKVTSSSDIIMNY